jgi:transcription-repair coupling factor (superfamily II helicase)
LPDAASHLLQLALLRIQARALGVRRLELGPLGGSMSFEERNTVNPHAVLQLIQKQARDYRMDGPLKLRIQQEFDTPLERFAFAERLMQSLASDAASSKRS